MPLTVATTSDPRLRAEATLAAPVGRGAPSTAPVRLIQEWLGLHGHAVPIDGGFGDATETAVRAFQTAKGLGVTGIVDQATLDVLVQPMLSAVAATPPAGAALGAAIVYLARAHLAELPREIGGENSGPWVRLYMGGRQGASWPWCAGFVSYVVGRACAATGQPLPVKSTFSCDLLATDAQAHGKFVGSAGVNNAAQAGWIFLRQKGTGDWEHTGLVVGSSGTSFSTIEGNTNDDGSREGYEVCARTRSYGSYDFVRI